MFVEKVDLREREEVEIVFVCQQRQVWRRAAVLVEVLVDNWLANVVVYYCLLMLD